MALHVNLALMRPEWMQVILGEGAIAVLGFRVHQAMGKSPETLNIDLYIALVDVDFKSAIASTERESNLHKDLRRVHQDNRGASTIKNRVH